MEHVSLTGRIFRGAALTLILLFFMFPIVWILLMSFQSNEQILRIPPRLLFEPTLANYRALISGQLQTAAGNLEIPFMHNLWNSFVLSSAAVVLALILGVPAAYAFARFQFRLGATIAFTLLSFRFAPPLLVLLPLILWIVLGYFEDNSRDSEHAYRLAGHGWGETVARIAVPLAGPGIAAAGLLSFIFCWNNFVFALILASADKQPVTVGALAFVTASGIQYGQIAAAIVLSVTPTLLLALYAQRYLVEGLSLGAVKG